MGYKRRMPAEHKGLPMLPFATKAAWIAWIRDHHADTDGIWIKFAKKDTGIASITYEQAREGAIMYGWIDGLKNAFDAQWYLIRITPRRARSRWSKINRDIAKELIARGKMRKAGHAEIERAKADGRWDAAYDPPSKIQPHPELTKALAASPKAKAFFKTISKANRYAILYPLHDAKRAETRTRRIKKFIAMLERGEVPHPDR